MQLLVSENERFSIVIFGSDFRLYIKKKKKKKKASNDIHKSY